MWQLVAAYCWLRPQWSPPASWSQSSPLHHLVPVTGSGSWFLIFFGKFYPFLTRILDNYGPVPVRARSSPAPAEKLGWPHISSLCRPQAALSTLGRHQTRRPRPAPYFPANWKCLVGYGLISILGFNAVRRDGSQNYSLENIQNNDLWTLLHLQNNKRTKQYNHIINRDKTSKPKSIYWINVALTIQANYSQENYLTFESFFYL